jgi:hypothetical protein
MLAQINRTALIMALETLFGRVQRRAGFCQMLPERRAKPENGSSGG